MTMKTSTTISLLDKYLDKILGGNNLDILQTMPNNSIDLIITSPPYYKQRNYGNLEKEIGNEQTEEEYLNNLLKILKECVRIIKPTGTIVFNLGDKYINGSLRLIPYKFAIRAIEEENLLLINNVTWIKSNPTPRQDKSKLVQATEPFFIFAKTKQYKFYLNKFFQHLDENHTPIKVSDKKGKKYLEMIEQSDLRDEEKKNAKKALFEAIEKIKNGEIVDFRMKIRGIHKLAYGGQAGGRNNQIIKNGFTIINILGKKMKKDIIESPVENTKAINHIAVYPLNIIKEFIKLLTDENDIVLDPFCGSGTTCLAAKQLNRHFIGIEINKNYVKEANLRLANNK